MLTTTRQDRLLFFSVPLVALLVLALAGFLWEGRSSVSTNTDSLIQLCMIGLATAILLWWSLSSGYVFYLCLRYRNDAQQQRLGFIPRFISTTVFALCGLGLLSQPALATPLQDGATTVLSQTAESQEQLSPFFSSGGGIEEKVSPATTPEAKQLSVIPADYEPVSAQSSYLPLSPFFASPDSESAQGRPETEATHTVLAGDTLWTIAQEKLGAEEPQEILRQIKQIIDANPEQLSSSDDFIYPGQVLTLPTNP